MEKLCIFVGIAVGSVAFGWGADALGASFMISFLVSGLGSLVGCWAGWKAFQTWFR